MEDRRGKLPMSDPALPVVSGAVVRKEDSSETRRLAMDRNRVLLLLGSQVHGSGFMN